MKVNHNITSAEKRKRRVRRKVRGTTLRPRVTVFRSNKHLYVQVIDDTKGVTITSSSDVAKDLVKQLEGKKKVEKAKVLADTVAKNLQKAKIAAVVFDRGSYRYHGCVKLIAEELRSAGIQV